MPDATTRNAMPPGWNEAFAALPLERPDADSWNRITARLDARRRQRWPVWLAAAAALVIAVALPWRQWQQANPSVETGQGDHAGNRRAGRDAGTTASRVGTTRSIAGDGARRTRVQRGRGQRRQRPRPAARRHRCRADAARCWRWPASARYGANAWRRYALSSASKARGAWLAAQGERYDGALVRVD